MSDLNSYDIIDITDLPVATTVGDNDQIVVQQADQALARRMTIAEIVTPARIQAGIGFVPANAALIGMANGLATLDATGRIAPEHLPPNLGGLFFSGPWNASLNIPALASGVGVNGSMYRVTVAGTTVLDGIAEWYVGDTAVYGAGQWVKFDGLTNEITSVAGRTGAISLTVSDVAGAAPVASPNFSGIVTVPTPAPLDNSNRAASTNYVQAALAAGLPVKLTGAVLATGITGANGIATELAPSGVTAGTYAGIIVAANGLITSAQPMTTLGGYGIRDAVAVGATIDLAVAGKLLLNRSSVAGSVPTLSQVGQGELYVNTADNRLYTQNVYGQIVQANAPTNLQVLSALGFVPLSSTQTVDLGQF